MEFSRRQFFRRFWTPGDDPSPQRIARYEVMETYARTQLLPYDFTLTKDQETELLAAVRLVLEKATDSELFSTLIRGRLEEAVEAKVLPWRERSSLAAQSDRLQEIRHVAPDYVSAFLSSHANTQIVEQLKQTYQIEDTAELEKMLKEQVRYWLVDVDDRLIAQYDIISVRDLVFAQLRSWC